MKHETWQERFDREFKYVKDGQWANMVNAYDEDDQLIGKGRTSRAYMVPEAIKSFISKELSLATGEKDKKFEELIIRLIVESSAHPATTAEGDNFTSRGYNMGYQAALNELRFILRKEYIL